MSGFYPWAMRSAAAILFVIAIVVPLLSLIGSVVTLSGVGETGALESYSPGGLHGQLWPILLSVAAAVQNAVWPFFGAAILCRWDRNMTSKVPAA